MHKLLNITPLSLGSWAGWIGGCEFDPNWVCSHPNDLLDRETWFAQDYTFVQFYQRANHNSTIFRPVNTVFHHEDKKRPGDATFRTWMNLNFYAVRLLSRLVRSLRRRATSTISSVLRRALASCSFGLYRSGCASFIIQDPRR
jgi:hypothetical protein